MPRAVVQPLEPFAPTLRSRDVGDTKASGKGFWELLAEHGPNRAGTSRSESKHAKDDTAEAQIPESPVASPAQNSAEKTAEKPESDGHTSEESAAPSADDLTLAVAIAAGYQPLTIHSLNDQLLRADPSLRMGRQASSEATEPPATAHAAQQESQGEANTRPTREHSERPTGELSNALNEGRNPAEPPKPTLPRPEFNERPLTESKVTREPERSVDPSRNNTPQGVRPQAPPPTSAAAAVPITPNTGKTHDSAAAKPTPAPAPAVASIGSASGRKPGGDAHMPRWDAQKSSLAARRGESAARTNELVTAQAARGLATAMSRQDGTVTLRLNPESLGFLRIKIEMGKGTLVAKFEASTEQARQLLEQSSQTLRASLEAKGWESSQVRVELLREVDPAAEMLRRLELLGGSAIDRQAAQDATAGQDQGWGGSGGDREQHSRRSGPSSRDRDGESDAASGLSGDPGETPSVTHVWSRLDTII